MTFDFIDYIFPRQCINCGSKGEYLCKKCKKTLQPHPEICPMCHRFSKDYQTCRECRCNKNNYLEGIIIPFIYTKLLKKLIIKLKYFHKKDIGNFLVDRLILALQANEIFQKNFHFCPPLSKEGWCPALRDKLHTGGFKNNSKLVISFIPSHRYRKYFIKGYNQSQVLAEKLGQKLDISVIAIANKKKYTKTQASLKRNDRLHNLKNVFYLEENLKFTGNETLLIVDDITTTGATMNELAKIIKEKYPKIKFRGIVLGRHIG